MSVRKEFQTFPLNEQGKQAAETVAEAFTQCLNTVEAFVGGRELALVITNLQTAKMWAVNGLAQSYRTTTD